MSESIGQRVFAIRRDLGDGWKNPMSQADFGTLLSRKSGRAYDSAMVSRMENGDRKISLDEVALIAGLDPKKRGREWLAWGENDKPTDQGGLDDIEAGAVMLTPAQLARAEEQAAATLAAKRQAATNEPRARQPRKRAR